jgi:hypothetical protein
LKDKFIVVGADGTSGHLFKASWLGGNMDVDCGDKKYRFDKSGTFFNQTVTIRSQEGEQFAKIYADFPFFGISRRGKVVMKSGNEFVWRERGLFNRKWELIDKGGMVIKSKEVNGLFSINGEIQAAVDTEENRLLGMLGLYLRNSFGVQNAITFWLGISVFLLIGLRYFSN